jgi:very-short-patch-repair endonuclease
MATTSSSTLYHPYLSKGVQAKLTAATGLPPKQALIQLLQEEPDIKAISKRTQINRTQIYQALAHFNLHRPAYNHSTRMKEWYRHQPPEKGKQLTRKANLAARGSRKSREYLLKRAAHNQQSKEPTEGEALVIQVLLQNNIENIPQLAFDIFNIDVAIPSIKLAIEVNGGNWHTTPSHQEGDAKKRDCLVANGWKVVYLWGSPHNIEQAAQDLIPSILESQPTLLV